jgi:hypothetical protein
MSAGAVPELKRPADFHSLLGGSAGRFGYKSTTYLLDSMFLPG